MEAIDTSKLLRREDDVAAKEFRVVVTGVQSWWRKVQRCPPNRTTIRHLQQGALQTFNYVMVCAVWCSVVPAWTDHKI
jgi:hypothetical protein